MWKLINNKSISRYLQIVSITSPWLTSDPLGQVLGLHLPWDHRSALWDCKIQVQKWSIQVMQRSQRWWSYKLMAPNTSFNVLRAFQQAHNEFGVGIIHEWLFHSFAKPKTLGFTAATTSIIPDFVFLSHREITFFPYCLWWYLLTISYQGSGGADQLIMIKEAKTMEGRWRKIFEKHQASKKCSLMLRTMKRMEHVFGLAISPTHQRKKKHPKPRKATTHYCSNMTLLRLNLLQWLPSFPSICSDLGDWRARFLI